MLSAVAARRAAKAALASTLGGTENDAIVVDSVVTPDGASTPPTSGDARLENRPKPRQKRKRALGNNSRNQSPEKKRPSAASNASYHEQESTPSRRARFTQTQEAYSPNRAEPENEDEESSGSSDERSDAGVDDASSLRWPVA
jgi:hypothetical protein